MKLKRICVAATIGLFGLVSCSDQEIKELEASNQTLLTLTEQQDSIINEVANYINHFEDNLESIIHQEGIIVQTSANKENSKETQLNLISNHLEAVDSLLSQNQAIIDSLSERLNASEGRWYTLKKTVNRLQIKLKEKNQEVNDLRDKLGIALDEIYVLKQNKLILMDARDSLLATSGSLEDTLAQQRAKNLAQAQLIRQQADDISQAFYLAGSKQELKELEVLETEGGIAGIGRVKTLNENLKPEAFQPIDTREKKVFAIHSKKAQLITPHPVDAYAFIPSEDGKTIVGLEVTAPERFWGASKYLVVLTD